MIGLDTNLLVRFLTRDDPEQAAAVDALFEGLSEAAPGLISREVVVELVWVLERAYGFEREAIGRMLFGLLEAKEFVVEGADRVGLAASRYVKGGPGFSDQMILLAAVGEGGTLVTLDRKLAREEGAGLAVS